MTRQCALEGLCCSERPGKAAYELIAPQADAPRHEDAVLWSPGLGWKLRQVRWQAAGLREAEQLVCGPDGTNMQPWVHRTDCHVDGEDHVATLLSR